MRPEHCGQRSPHLGREQRLGLPAPTIAHAWLPDHPQVEIITPVQHITSGFTLNLRDDRYENKRHKTRELHSTSPATLIPSQFG